MRLFLDGIPYLRPLAIIDKPHEGLPYDFVLLDHSSSGELLNNSGNNQVWDEDDWGEGLDFYPVTFTINFAIQPLAYTELWHGFRFYLQEFDPTPSTGPIIFIKTISQLSHPVVRPDADTAGFIAHTFQLNKNKVSSDKQLRLLYTNLCGRTITGNDLKFSIAGVAV